MEDNHHLSKKHRSEKNSNGITTIFALILTEINILPSLRELFPNIIMEKTPILVIRVEPDPWQISSYNIQPLFIVDIVKPPENEVTLKVELMADMVVELGFPASHLREMTISKATK